MPARSIKVWNSTTSEWEDVAVASPDTSSFVLNSLFANKGTIAAASAASTPAALSVGSNGQMLMADLSATTGLRYVDPPANRNLVINGAMQVHQRGTSVTGITGSGFATADRWAPFRDTAGTWTESIESDAPTGSGLAKSVKMLCTTANNSLSAGSLFIQRTLLEGHDVQRIKKGTSSAEQLTLSFWVKSNVPGTYVAELRDNDNTRAVSATYTISASATWERKTITFPADTTGALDNDNARSLDVQFALVAGTTYTSGTLQTTWASVTNANRYVGQTNLAAAVNNYWQITGVQLETGPVATPFEFEPYEATLRKCQRYYYLHASGTNKIVCSAGYPSATEIVGVVHFPTTMRTAPSLVASSGTDYYRNANIVGGDNFNSLTIFTPQENAAMVYNDSQASGTALAGGQVIRTNDAAASVAFSAEL